jgi:hypothetical protein
MLHRLAGRIRPVLPPAGVRPVGAHGDVSRKPLKRKTIALACARNEPQVKLVTCILSVHSFMVDKSAPHLIIGVADGTADLRRAGE